MIPTVEMIDAGWKATLGLNKLQVERILVAALAAMPPEDDVTAIKRMAMSVGMEFTPHKQAPVQADAEHEAMPGPAARGIVAAFEEAYPELYYHIAKGKICAGEPLYGAIITTTGTAEIGHGESNGSADDAFQIAIKNAGITMPDRSPDLSAENERLPQDVINLVIAAREFWEIAMDESDESAALDSALEAFSSRVPYENDPEEDRAALERK